MFFLAGECCDGAVGQDGFMEEDSHTGVLCALQTTPWKKGVELLGRGSVINGAYPV